MVAHDHLLYLEEVVALLDYREVEVVVLLDCRVDWEVVVEAVENTPPMNIVFLLIYFLPRLCTKRARSRSK